MRVKVSKLMADTIRKKCKAAGLKYGVTLEKHTQSQFTAFCDYDMWRHEEVWEAETNCFKVIKIVYPCEYYANPRYLTSNDLRSVYASSDKTYDGFFREVLKEIEI